MTDVRAAEQRQAQRARKREHQPRTSHTETDTAWRDQALCKGSDPDMFVPKESTGFKRKNTAPPPVVAAMCGLCPVAGNCLAAGIDEQHGYWGGTTPYERQWLRGLLRDNERTYCRPGPRRFALVMNVAARSGLFSE